MRKRICNKVLLKFMSVGAFFLGGGGGRDGEVACLACFFLGGGKGMGKLPVSPAFFRGRGVGKVPVSHTKNLSH